MDWLWLLAAGFAGLFVGWLLGLAGQVSVLLRPGRKYTVGGRDYALVPLDEAGGELFWENENLRRAVDRMREALRDLDEMF